MQIAHQFIYFIFQTTMFYSILVFNLLDIFESYFLRDFGSLVSYF